MDIFIKLNPENSQDLEKLKDISDKLNGTAVPIIPLRPAGEAESPVIETQKQTTGAKETKTEEPKADVQAEGKTTIEDVRKGLIELKDAKGSEAAKAILTEFAASKTSDLSEDKYAEVVARIVEELI